jgi:hypothetical protein
MPRERSEQMEQGVREERRRRRATCAMREQLKTAVSLDLALRSVCAARVGMCRPRLS